MGAQPTARDRPCRAAAIPGGEHAGDLGPRAGAISAAESDEALQLVQSTIDDVLPGFEMWDVKPDDFLDLPDGKVGLYDLEFAHLFGRRYYDLAELLTSLRCRFGAPSAATVLLRDFAQRQSSPPDAFARAFLPVLLAKVLALLHDVPQDASLDPAAVQDLFHRCLERDMQALP